MSNPHALLASPISMAKPHRLTEVSSWHEHIPFAFALVAAARPRVLVELGTHRGDSYFAFCQAVAALGLPTSCYAVDTWQGDEHAGLYGEEIFEEIQAAHDSRYGRFSRLIRSTFDEAREHFPDGSIDLLHVDGLHSQEAVAHDFETWKPKLSDRSVVIFHDINVRERDFGVWNFWKEISARYPSFDFVHGHGLGVIAFGKAAPAEIQELCALPEVDRHVVRERFAALGERVGLSAKVERFSQGEEARPYLAKLRAESATAREELARAQVELARRDERLVNVTRESQQKLKAANETANGLREQLRSADRLHRGIQQELERLGTLVTESNKGWLARVVDWVKKNNRIRLAHRKARRGELLYGRDPLLSLPARTEVTGYGPIALLRRMNRARLARRKALPRSSRVSVEQVTAAPVTPKPVIQAAEPSALSSLTSIKATHEESWEAYGRLSAELKRLHAARGSVIEVTRPHLFEAGGDLLAAAKRLSLPLVPAPRVSIIVPVFNHLKETLECLEALVASTPSNDFEVIVVDDASTDASATALPGIPNLRYFRNGANGGFVVSCTRGANESRGEYLVFLNNDAQVTPGWLPPLLETFATFLRVGAVGPKVIYPSGHLQEAGSMINPDLSITMVGLEDDPGRARYNYAREVHYCSGACLMVPRRRFEEVGGFTEALRPAYYEDCDLQLKLRAIGLRSVYQPASLVIHHLSRTSEGVPNPSGFKARQIARNAQWMREQWGDVVDTMHAVRLIAFYLPQFHPIQENELWWGKGFTEWTNVAKALPIFHGHEQPRLPTDLGFYDLRLPEIMKEQARLAEAYGIAGFCFYYYWFNGRRLLEAPIERLLDDPAASPFCLCWANENWTRRWDGGDGESEILMGQAHSDEDDDAVIRDLIRFLRHPSYLRVSGKPMLLVYRVGLFPDIWRTAALWRDVCRQEGIGEIHLVRVDSFDDATNVRPPSEDGFDAAVEFPPHGTGLPATSPPAPVRNDFTGHIFDYETLVLRSAQHKEAGYLHYRSVTPRWDNTPRRPTSSTIFINSSPGAYQAYLEEVLRYTREQNVGEDRLVFINAWNEWAEGAHLEPERRYGRTYLEATLAAVTSHLVDSGS